MAQHIPDDLRARIESEVRDEYHESSPKEASVPPATIRPTRVAEPAEQEEDESYWNVLKGVGAAIAVVAALRLAQATAAHVGKKAVKAIRRRLTPAPEEGEYEEYDDYADYDEGDDGAGIPWEEDPTPDPRRGLLHYGDQ